MRITSLLILSSLSPSVAATAIALRGKNDQHKNGEVVDEHPTHDHGRRKLGDKIVGKPMLSGYANGLQQDFDYSSDSGPMCGMWADYTSKGQKHPDRQYRFYTCSVGSDHAQTDKRQTTYESSWNEDFTFVCDADKIMTGFASTTNKIRVDRRYQATCSQFENLQPNTKGCKGFNAKYPTKGFYDNKYERNLDYTCPSGTVLTGVHSAFDKKKDDRKFKFQCCPLIAGKTPKTDPADLDEAYTQIAVSAIWSDYVNEDPAEDFSVDAELKDSFDAELDAEINGSDGAFCGFSASNYDRTWNDRQYRFKTCRPSTLASNRLEVTTTSGHDYQQTSLISCESNGGVLTKIESTYSKASSDRRWNYECRTFENMETSNCIWTGWANTFSKFPDYSSGFDYECGAGTVMAGISSYYDPDEKDRRFKFRCCQWTETATDY